MLQPMVVVQRVLARQADLATGEPRYLVLHPSAPSGEWVAQQRVLNPDVLYQFDLQQSARQPGFVSPAAALPAPYGAAPPNTGDWQSATAADGRPYWYPCTPARPPGRRRHPRR